MLPFRKTKTILNLPWCRRVAERFCKLRNIKVDSTIVDLYIQFFLQEVVVHGILHLNWKEEDTHIVTEVFEEDLQHVFDSHIPTDWQLSLWLCEYIFDIYKKIQGNPVTRFIEHWYRRCLGAGPKRSRNEHNNRTRNNDGLGSTDESVCRAGSDD